MYGVREAGGSKDIKAEELKISNLAAGETLILSGEGSVSDVAPGTKLLELGTLSFASGTGQASNYTFIGGSFTYIFLNPLKSKAGVINFLKNLKGGKNKKMVPSKTSHRSRFAIGEKITLSTPDRSVEINPCTMRNGNCN